MSVISVVRTWKQVNREFRFTLGYLESSRLWAGEMMPSMVKALSAQV